MKLRRRQFIAISAIAMAGAYGLTARKQFHEWRGLAFGSDFVLQIYGEPDKSHALRDLVEARIAQLERAFSLFDENSELSKLNQQGVLKHPSRDFFRLYDYAALVFAKTNGCFDPSVQNLWLGEGMQGDFSHLNRDGQGLKTRRKGQKFTFNGMAQGYASDQILQLLRMHGFEQSLVNIGEWSAGNRRFLIGQGDALPRITLQQAALATSRPDASVNRQFGSHILHPKGQKSLWQEVSVKAETACLADGYSTALCFLDEDQIRDLCMQNHEIIEVHLRAFNGDYIRI